VGSELFGLDPNAAAERREVLGEPPLHSLRAHDAPGLDRIRRYPKQDVRVVVLRKTDGSPSLNAS
jgi:hypothetical protein